MRQLYTVYDTVAKTILPTVILEHGDAPAIRAFHDALGQQGSLLAQHPADFTLLIVGTIMDDGSIVVPDNPSVLATGQAWLEAKKAEATNG